MQVKINTSIAGAGFSYSPGEVVEVPDDEEAQRWCAAGHATAVDKQARKPKAKKTANKPPVK